MTPIPLPAIDLSSAVIGQSFTLDLSGVSSLLPFSPPPPAYLRLYNESGCELSYRSASGAGDTIPAGGWPLFPLTSHDSGITLVVTRILSTGQVATLNATFYPPGEAVPEAPVLGNSPTSQSRVIAIPTMPHFAPTLDELACLPNATTSIASILTPISGQTAVTIYLYALPLVMRGPRYTSANLLLNSRDSGGAVQGTLTLGVIKLWAGVPVPPLIQPIAAGPLTLLPVVTHLSLDLALDNGYPAGSTAALTGTILLDLDLKGQAPPPAIGNGNLTPIGVTY